MTNDNTTIRINEKLTLYRRANSKRWQARLLLENGEWHRFSTKTTDLDAAKDFALKQYYTADFRKNNNLPESTRKLRRVAMFTRNRMQEELAAGGGRVAFVDYISAVARRVRKTAENETRKCLGTIQFSLLSTTSSVRSFI